MSDTDENEAAARTREIQNMCTETKQEYAEYLRKRREEAAAASEGSKEGA